MKLKVSLAAFGVLLSFSAFDVAAQYCRTPICNVEVTVNIVGGKCVVDSIAAKPNPVMIGTGTHVIQWDIATKGYEFTQSGIAFKDVVGASTDFSGPKHPAPQRWTWADKHQAKENGKKYDYSVEVKDASGNVCRVDPTVVNE